MGPLKTYSTSRRGSKVITAPSSPSRFIPKRSTWRGGGSTSSPAGMGVIERIRRPPSASMTALSMGTRRLSQRYFSSCSTSAS